MEKLNRKSGHSTRISLVTMLSCLLLGGGALGQRQAQRGILLKPQSAPLLQANGGGCAVGQIDLRITTGGDDLRGGKNNLDVEVHFANGDMQTAANVNKGANWPNNSVHAVSVHLNHPVSPDQIKQLRLVHSAQGGFHPNANVASPEIGLLQGIQSEDNWDMAEVQAFALGNGINMPIAYWGEHKFTGSNPALDINVRPGAGCPSPNQVSKISFTFWTADDDLRGGNDNLNITIHFADGSTQAEQNVNHSQRWPDGSTKGAEVLLNRPVPIDQIRGITLSDTFGTGFGHDNWNMASMQADAWVNNSYHTIAKSGFHKFSGDPSGPTSRQITIKTHPIN